MPRASGEPGLFKRAASQEPERFLMNPGPRLVHDQGTGLKILYRAFWARMFLRRRMLLGVTSICSSSLMNSMARSRVNGRTGLKVMFSSFPAARIFESFFSLQAFTSRSFSRLCSPTIIPS